jgi:hypothetical protein
MQPLSVTGGWLDLLMGFVIIKIGIKNTLFEKFSVVPGPAHR